MLFKTPQDKKTSLKPYINVGGCFDIPTAVFLKGSKGETILNGGLGAIVAITGTGNNYKSTILHYLMLSALNKILTSVKTGAGTYDTEVNIAISRLEELSERFDYVPDNPITSDDPIWDVTDKSTETGDEWIARLDAYIKEKLKHLGKNSVTWTALKDPYVDKSLVTPIPIFSQIDSFSELESEKTTQMLESSLDDSSNNTFAMKKNLFKSKFLSQMPRRTKQSGLYILLAAHIGEKIDMVTGPAKYNQPGKKLQYMKSSEVIKGIPPNSYYLFNNLWQAHTATSLINKTTMLPEYPYDKNEEHATDLNIVKMTSVRNKSGTSGFTLEVVVSQTEGVQPELTEFHFIKKRDRFGIEGNLTSYNLIAYPDIKLSRTKVRRKLAESPKLRRALNITSELLQLKIYHPRYLRMGLWVPIDILKKDLEDLGYDWDEILETRGWYAPDQYNKSLPNYLSIIDLLKMRIGVYIPYWLDKEKKNKIKEKIKKLGRENDKK